MNRNEVWIQRKFTALSLIECDYCKTKQKYAIILKDDTLCCKHCFLDYQVDRSYKRELKESDIKENNMD